MTDSAQETARARDLTAKVGRLYRRRAELAQERFKERTQQAFNDQIAELLAKPMAPWDIWTQWFDYATDLTQRTILYWDSLRRRGNDYIAHERAGQPPVLNFDYETVLDARTFERPVNLALVRIAPPPGVPVDPKSRPYVIIDPRAGHGPGSGAFRDDSQVGVVLQEGHPVYFVIFFPEPDARSDADRRVRRRAAVRAQGSRASPGQPQARDRRQPPGRLGGIDARLVEP